MGSKQRASDRGSERARLIVTGHIGDLRAWDAVMLIGPREVAVEAETRPRDVQALQRRLASKRRDDPNVSGVVLLLADTRHNRCLIKEQAEAMRADLPLPAESILRALAEGRDPEGSGIVLV
jgi:hypothetical protein